MIPVIWHLGDNFWDTALPRYILDCAAHCRHFVGLEHASTVPGDVGVIVIPGRHSAGQEHYRKLRDASAYFHRRVVFVIIGDEEGIFHAEEIRLPHSLIWWFMPPLAPKQDVDRVCINGWPTGCRETLQFLGTHQKNLDWAFMGQMTHIRRVQCIDALQSASSNGYMLPTAGFTQGLDRPLYYRKMADARMAPCPAGPCTPDSFRFAEALEARCIPIADDKIQHAWYPEGYFRYALGEQNPPFPIISDWSTLPAVLDEWLDGWDAKINRCDEWWRGKKAEWMLRMREDLNVR